MQFQSVVDATKCANEGNAEAQVWLGVYYYEQWKHYDEAFKWFTLSAEQGNAQAIFGLSLCYYNGHGTTKSPTRAMECLLKCAKKNYLPAIKVVASYYFAGELFPQNYSLALRWAKRGAKMGDVDMQYQVASCYKIRRNMRQAFKWWLVCAQNGHAMSQQNVGACYVKGWGVRKDYVQAAVWYQKAADQGHAYAMFCLGNMYMTGEGVAQDYDKAYEYFKKSSARGCDEATLNQAYCEFYGYGTSRNVTTAKYNLERVIYSTTAGDELKKQAQEFRKQTL